jgi:hypothetical protein
MRWLLVWRIMIFLRRSTTSSLSSGGADQDGRHRSFLVAKGEHVNGDHFGGGGDGRAPVG